MDAEVLTVAYYDEDNKWSEVSPYIQSQLPLNDICISVVPEPPYELISEPLKISPKFIKHDNAFWGEAFEDAFRKPYLWIYLLYYTSIEHFKSTSKPKIREMVNTITEQRIEWLILFVHPITSTPKTSHRALYRAYERISLEINSMFGVRQCVKLYCNESKAFLCNDIDCYKSYIDELINAMNRGISNGLCNRSAFFLEEINKVEETKDFYLYFLMKEGLAATYAIAGLNKVSKVLYDQILSPPEMYVQNFGSITEDELTRVSEITMQELRSNNKAISHLYLRKYIFSCQKRLLEADEDYIGIGHLSLNFVCTCLGLFKTISEREEKYLGSIWVYNHSLELAKYLQAKSKGNF